jgi:hypothetical protein
MAAQGDEVIEQAQRLDPVGGDAQLLAALAQGGGDGVLAGLEVTAGQGVVAGPPTHGQRPAGERIG